MAMMMGERCVEKLFTDFAWRRRTIASKERGEIKRCSNGIRIQRRVTGSAAYDGGGDDDVVVIVVAVVMPLSTYDAWSAERMQREEDCEYEHNVIRVSWTSLAKSRT